MHRLLQDFKKKTLDQLPTNIAKIDSIELNILYFKLEV